MTKKQRGGILLLIAIGVVPLLEPALSGAPLPIVGLVALALAIASVLSKKTGNS